MLWYISNRELADSSHEPPNAPWTMPTNASGGSDASNSSAGGYGRSASGGSGGAFFAATLAAGGANESPLVFWTTSLILVSFCWVLSAHFYGFQMMRVGLHVRVGCSYLIYTKSLKLSQAVMGKMTNLLSNDLDKFNYVCIMIPFLWVGPIQTIVSLSLLWPLLGPSCIGSLVILLLLTPVQFYLSSKFSSYRRRIAACTDERVRKLNETMMSLKLIKLYGWEMAFRHILFDSRARETALIDRVGIIKGINAALMYTSSKLVLFVTIIFHCLVFDQLLDAKTLFMSMAMLNNVQFTMTQLMPRLVSLGGESLVSLNRIRDFLLSQEFEPSNKLWLEPIREPEDLGRLQIADQCAASNSDKQLKSLWEMFDTNKLIPGTIVASKQKGAFIHCQAMGARWPQATTKTLDSISFSCEAPDLVIICGQVACGKSSLFLSLLNELTINEGTARVSGSVSFSSQKAWIFTGTIRENIIFGSKFDEARYNQIVNICALGHDFDILENSDQTYINEESLSGGQKARVNLARCLYRDCDIYLLDDPLSAIDGPVAAHIFLEAIKGFLKDKLVLLSTHQLKFLKDCDKILLLDQGRRLSYCTFDELRQMFSAPPGHFFTSKQLEQLSFLQTAFQMSTELNGRTERIVESISSNETHQSCSEALPDGIEEKFPELKPAQRINHGTSSEQIKDSLPNNSKSLQCSACFVRPIYTADENSKRIRTEKNDVSVQSSVRPSNCSNNQVVDNLTLELEANNAELTSEHGSVQGCKSNERDLTETTNKTRQTFPTDGHAPYSSRCDEERTARTNNEIGISSDSIITTNENVVIQLAEVEPSNIRSTLSALVMDNGFVTRAAIKSGQNQTNAPATAVTHAGLSSKHVHGATDLTGTATSHSSCTARASSINHDGGRLKLLTLEVKANEELAKECRQGVPCAQVGSQCSDSASEYYRSTLAQPVPVERGSNTSSTRPWTHKQIDPAHSKSIMDRTAGGPSAEEDLSSDNKLPGFDVWIAYYTQSSQVRLMIFILFLILTQVLFSSVDIYLTVWSVIEQNRALLTHISSTNQLILDSSRHVSFINSTSAIHTIYGRPIGYNCHVTKWKNMSDSRNDYETIPTSGDKFEYDCVANLTDGTVDGVQVVRITTNSSMPPVLYLPKVSDILGPILNLVSRITYRDSILLSYIGLTENSDAETLAEPLVERANYSVDHKLDTALATETLDFPSNSPDSPTKIIYDRDIVEESEAALNVKTIYRPLYTMVDKLKSFNHATVYALLLVTLFISSAITNVLSYSTSNKSAKKLYKKLIDSALFARLEFFDCNPMGRFINRATRDIGIIDEAIPYNANQSYDALLQTAATFIVVSAVDFRLAPLSLVILFIFLIYHAIHVKPTKDIQRMEGMLRSPIISHISTTLDGLHTIRVTKSEKRFIETFMRHQDAHSSVFLCKIGCNRCMAVVLDWLNASYIGIIAFAAVTSGMSGPSAGLIITSAMLLSGLTQHGLMKLTETESLMTSVERVIEYCNLPQEECRTKRGNRRPGVVITHGCKAIWPTNGSLEFRNVDLYYNRNSNKPVLRNLSFKVNANEKVGIIGRTGAGKSSIITTIFRLYDYDGTIFLDGVDIKTLNLTELRTSIGIIPQNPVLFATTIRGNLDPLSMYDDYSLWSALEKANMRETISALPGQLNYDIGYGGLSTGQKQLICLARVLLRQNKLIIMDEATANVDLSTDALIQTTIRREFEHCTIITIAHRLETILDCNRVMVLDSGRIVDFDSPERLATKRNPCFIDLVHKAGA